jgi:cytochrome d ubiquinol oxidase subunit I
MVAVGSNMSAVWILVANAWMQYPVGQEFNPDTARFEMQSFADVALSPYAVSKFTHTTSSSMMVGALFVLSISSWFLLRKRHVLMAKRSIVVASIFGLVASVFVIFNGDESAYKIAEVQPMKLAAFEGLWEGEEGAGLVALGAVNQAKRVDNDEDPFQFELRIPGLLSLMANRSFGSFVPGMKDLVYGNEEHNIIGGVEKMAKGKIALESLDNYKRAKKENNEEAAAQYLATFNENKEFLGYGFLEKPEELVPPVALSFNAFHVMVALGTLFPLVFIAYLYFSIKRTIQNKTLLLAGGTTLYLLGMIASQAGWIVAEVGRQPWTIQGLLPVTIARTNLTAGTVQTTFWIFLVLFTTLLLAEICIMAKQVSIGPKEN